MTDDGSRHKMQAGVSSGLETRPGRKLDFQNKKKTSIRELSEILKEEGHALPGEEGEWRQRVG